MLIEAWSHTFLVVVILTFLACRVLEDVDESYRAQEMRGENVS